MTKLINGKNNIHNFSVTTQHAEHSTKQLLKVKGRIWQFRGISSFHEYRQRPNHMNVTKFSSKEGYEKSVGNDRVFNVLNTK